MQYCGKIDTFRHYNCMRKGKGRHYTGDAVEDEILYKNMEFIPGSG